jgi:tetratricopeptide (TPR) repeat protein
MQRIEALAACAQGDVDRCIEALDRVHERLSRANAPSDRRSNALALRTLVDLAGLHLESGNAAGAESYLTQAEKLFEHNGTSRPELRTSYLCWRARVALFCGEPRRAVRMLNDAQLIARDNGLITSTMLTSYQLGCTFLQVRQRVPAREHAQNAAQLGELLTNAPEHVYTSLLLADVERVCGHSEQAVARARSAYEQFGKADPRSWSSALTVVLALDSAGRPFEALELLDTASIEFKQKSMHRYMGKSERIRAGLYANLSRAKEARVAIDNALQILERCGSLDELGKAYELSARLTRNRTHTKRSREIRAQLTID